MLQSSDAPVKPLDKYHSPEYHAQNDRITEFVSLTRRQTPPSQTMSALVCKPISQPSPAARNDPNPPPLPPNGLHPHEPTLRPPLQHPLTRSLRRRGRHPHVLPRGVPVPARSYYPHHSPPPSNAPLAALGTASSASSPRAPNPSTSPTFPHTRSPSLFASPSSPMLDLVSPSPTRPSLQPSTPSYTNLPLRSVPPISIELA
jgi:hypothetical protein